MLSCDAADFVAENHLRIIPLNSDAAAEQKNKMVLGGGGGGVPDGFNHLFITESVTSADLAQGDTLTIESQH